VSAKAKGLNEADTDALVALYGNKLPRIKTKGRPSEVGELVNAIDSVLAEMDAPQVEDSIEVVDDLEVVE
jgi:hypothetical protein